MLSMMFDWFMKEICLFTKWLVFFSDTHVRSSSSRVETVALNIRFYKKKKKLPCFSCHSVWVFQSLSLSLLSPLTCLWVLMLTHSIREWVGWHVLLINLYLQSVFAQSNNRLFWLRRLWASVQEETKNEFCSTRDQQEMMMMMPAMMVIYNNKTIMCASPYNFLVSCFLHHIFHLLLLSFMFAFHPVILPAILFRNVFHYKKRVRDLRVFPCLSKNLRWISLRGWKEWEANSCTTCPSSSSYTSSSDLVSRKKIRESSPEVNSCIRRQGLPSSSSTDALMMKTRRKIIRCWWWK